MKHLMTRLTILTALVASAALLPACNTLEGAGEDISDAGDAISDSAE